MTTTRLTKAQREAFDAAVLQTVSDRNQQATYVLRNSIDWPGKPWHRKGVTTPMVLRSCRRLERAGLVSEYLASAYVTMLSWQITDAGRAALQQENNHAE